MLSQNLGTQNLPSTCRIELRARKYKNLLSASISDTKRKEILDQLGTAGSDYRSHVYQKGFWGKKRSVTIEGLLEFIKTSIQFLDHSIQANKRVDGLYHAYNLMNYVSDDQVSLSNLSEMLEGQVAVLSSGYLSLDIKDNCIGRL